MRVQPIMRYTFAVAVGAVIGSGATLAAFGHRQTTYDDCMLDHLKPGMTNAVGDSVAQACYRKYSRHEANPFDQFDKK